MPSWSSTMTLTTAITSSTACRRFAGRPGQDRRLVLTVVLDATGLGRIGKTADLVCGKVLNLDHHISNEHFAQWEYFKPDYAATGEILTYLFDQWHITCLRP